MKVAALALAKSRLADSAAEFSAIDFERPSANALAYNRGIHSVGFARSSHHQIYSSVQQRQPRQRQAKEQEKDFPLHRSLTFRYSAHGSADFYSFRLFEIRMFATHVPMEI